MTEAGQGGLAVVISADDRQLAKALARMEANTKRSLENASREVDKLKRQFTKVELPRVRPMVIPAADARPFVSSLGVLQRTTVSSLALMRGAFAGAAAAFSLNEIRQASDAYTRTTNALKVAGLEGEALTGTYTRLYEIAQRQGAPLEETARLFGQITQAQKELGITTAEALKFTDGIGAALKVSGTSAQQASGALLGVSQALGAGTVRAEEYNQMLEGGLRPALQAVANGLKEAGGSLATLRQLVVDGKVSSTAFFRAFEAGRPSLDALARSASETSGQALTRLNNSLINLVGELDKATGASRALAGGLGSMATGFDSVAAKIPALVGPLRDLIGLAAQAQNALARIGASAAGANYTGKTLSDIQDMRNELAQVESEVTGARQRARNPADADNLNQAKIGRIADLRNRIAESERTFEARAEAQREANRARGLGQLIVPAGAVTPVSLGDFPVTGKPKGGGRSSGGGSRVNEYERELEALNKRTAALQQEASTIGESATAVEQARTAFELLNAAKAAGLPITDDLRRQIGAEAQTFADAKTRVDDLKAAQQDALQLQTFLGTSLTSALSDIAAGGVTGARAIENLTKRLADAALQAALLGQGPLASLFGTKGSDGGLGGLFGALFKGFSGFGAPAAVGAPLRLVGAMHSGGIVGRDVSFSKMVNPSIFAGAPRFHTGLTGKEFPAILEEGERVLTGAQDRRNAATMAGLTRLAATRSPVVTGARVTVINNGTPKDASVESAPDGTILVNLMDATNARGAAQAMRGRGAFSGAIDPRAAAQQRVG